MNLGSTISITSIREDVLKRAATPIILCSYPIQIARLLEKEQYLPLSLNAKLAEALLKYPQEQRIQRVIDEITSIISQCRAPILLEDYEMLFDPRYVIDTIKVFVEIARRQKVVVKWCGTLKGDSLIYAEPGFRDYRSFRIENYDIICAK